MANDLQSVNSFSDNSDAQPIVWYYHILTVCIATFLSLFSWIFMVISLYLIWTHPKWGNKVKWGFTVAVSIFTVVGDGLQSRKAQTKQQYIQQSMQEMNDTLKDHNCDVIKAIEDTHAAITVSKAVVSRCEAATLDGSDNAGVNGSNISTIAFWITVYWDGQIHKNGHTIMKIVYDIQNEKVVSVEVVETDTMVNIADPNWRYMLVLRLEHCAGHAARQFL